MYSGKHSKGDDASVGQELLQLSELSDADRKAIVVQQVVEDGDFSLHDALQLYELSEEQYASYLMNNFDENTDRVIASFKELNYSRESLEEIILIILARALTRCMKHLDSNDEDIAKKFRELCKSYM